MPSDGCMSFSADLELTADIVLRCSHMRAVSSSEQRNEKAAESLSTSTSRGGGEGEADGPVNQSATRSGGGVERSESAEGGSTSKYDRIPMWRTAFNVGYVQAGLLVSTVLLTTVAFEASFADRSVFCMLVAAADSKRAGRYCAG